MSLFLFFVGFVSILGQVALLRELVVALFGSELVYLLAISFWMVWTGVGALLGRRGDDRGAMSLCRGGFLLGAALPGSVLLARAARLLFRSTPGAYLPFEQQVAAILLVLAPVGLLIGYLFVRAARLRVRRGGSFAAAYGIESLGGVAGGIAATFLLAGRLPAISTALLASALSFGFAAWVGGRRWGCRIPGAVLGLLSLFLLLFLGSGIDRATLRWHFPALLESRDSPYGRVTLTRWGDPIAFFENGALAFETESTDPEEIVHLTLLQHPDPRRVLVLGGGVAGSVREALRHHLDHVTYVEIDETVLDLARRHLPATLSRFLDAPETRIVVGDGREFLRRAEETYDAVIVEMPEPVSGGANRYYTMEFFTECREKLVVGGVLGFRLASSEQYWTSQLIRRNGSIYRALTSVFSDAVVLPGTKNIFLASKENLPRDPDLLGRRYQERGLEGRLVTPFYIEYLYTNDRFREVEELLEGSGAPVNTDGRPICYSFTVFLWLSRFYRSLGEVSVGGGRFLWWALPAVGVLFLGSRRWRRAPLFLLVALAGMVGIVVEFAVLLRFQTASGVLYRDIGLILAGFMAGLGLSPLPGRAAARMRGGGALLAASLVAVSGLSIALFRWSGVGSAAVSSLWLLVVAASVGAVYCYATEKAAGSGPSLYAADLLGGSAGAVVGSLFLLPLLGLDAAMLWLSALSLFGLLLLRRG